MEFPHIQVPGFEPSEQPEIQALQTAVAQLGITLGQMQTAVAALQADFAPLAPVPNAQSAMDARVTGVAGLVAGLTPQVSSLQTTLLQVEQRLTRRGM